MPKQSTVKSAGATARVDEDLFQQLVNGTDKQIDSLSGSISQVLEKQDLLEKRLEKTYEIKDKAERDIQIRILDAEFATLQADVKDETDKLSKAYFGLNTIVEGFGSEYENLSKIPPQGEMLIANAKERLDAAILQLEEAKQKWNIFWRRDRAVKAATSAMELATQEVASAEILARQLARDMLLKRDWDQMSQDYMYMVRKLLDTVEKRIATLSLQLQKASARKINAFESKAQAAKAVEKLDEDLDVLEDTLRQEEESLQTLINGTPEHSAKDTEISEIRKNVEELRGRRNNAFALFQSKEDFSKRLEIDEKALMRLRDNHRMMSTILKSDTEERIVTFQDRLEAMKGESDQQIMEDVIKIGSEMDKANTENMAKTAVASDKAAMRILKSHPEKLGQAVEVTEALARHFQKMRIEQSELIAEWKRNYGIDPTKSSFFHYEEGAGASE